MDCAIRKCNSCKVNTPQCITYADPYDMGYQATWQCTKCLNLTGLVNSENMKIVNWNDGSSLIVEDGITWEYENDENWERTESLNPKI